MWVKHCTPLTGNGKHTTFKNGDDWGMVYHCFTHTTHRYLLLTRLSFHKLESDSPTSSTTERETIVHGVVLSVCSCAQLPLCFAAFMLSFSWKNEAMFNHFQSFIKGICDYYLLVIYHYGTSHFLWAIAHSYVQSPEGKHH